VTARDHSQQGKSVNEPMPDRATRVISRRTLLTRATAIGVGASAFGGPAVAGAPVAPANRLRRLNAALQGGALAEE
jgi:hypothetical protein